MNTRKTPITLGKWSTLLACWPIPEAQAKPPQSMMIEGKKLHITFETIEQARKLASYSNKVIPYSLSLQNLTLTLLMDESLAEILDIPAEDSKQAAENAQGFLDEFEIIEEIPDYDESESKNTPGQKDLPNSLPSLSLSTTLTRTPSLSDQGQGPYSPLDILSMVMPYLSKNDMAACLVLQGDLKTATQKHADKRSHQKKYGLFLPAALAAIQNTRDQDKLNGSALFLEEGNKKANLAFYLCESIQYFPKMRFTQPGLVCVAHFLGMEIIQDFSFYFMLDERFFPLCTIKISKKDKNNQDLKDYLIRLAKEYQYKLPVQVPSTQIHTKYLDALFALFPDDTQFKQLINLKRKLLTNVLSMHHVLNLNFSQLKGILDFNLRIEDVSHPNYSYSKVETLTEAKMTNIAEMIRLSPPQWSGVMNLGLTIPQVKAPYFSEQTLRAIREQGISYDDAVAYDLSVFEGVPVHFAELIFDFSVDEALILVKDLEEKNNRKSFFDHFFSNNLFARILDLSLSGKITVSQRRGEQLKEIHDKIQTAFFNEIHQKELDTSYPNALGEYEEKMHLLLINKGEEEKKQCRF